MAKIVHFYDLYNKKGEKMGRLPYKGSAAAFLHLNEDVDLVITVEAIQLDSGHIHHVERVDHFYTRDQFDYDMANRKNFLKEIGFGN